ncbi:MAG TPA: translocation/assembly module TamB domain-containing protein [Candidatus Sulfotelmatobacter sp.]
MSEPAVPLPRRRWWKYLLILTGVGLIVLLAGFWYLTTESFQAFVRRRIVAEVERVTGGRAEVGSIHTVPFHLQVEIRDMTVHGREAASDVPLAHVDHIVGRVKVISLLRTEFGFYEVAIEHPVIHIAFDADGTTNVPSHPVPKFFNQTSVERLLALSIDHLYVRRGELLWDDRNIPLDFAVHDSELQMDYSFLRSRFESRLLLGRVETKFDDYRPLAWMSSAEFSLGSTFVDVKSLRLNSGHTHIDAKGRISDFRKPQVEVMYDAFIDLAEAATVSRRHDLHAGILELKGKGNWSLDQFSSSGFLALRDFGWQSDRALVKNASATSDYAVTDSQLKLSKLQARLLGGTITGEAQVDNWLHSMPLSKAEERRRRNTISSEDMAVVTAVRPRSNKKSETQKPLEMQLGVVHLRLRDVAEEEIAAAVNTPAHSLNGFHPLGLTSGSLDARWVGTPRDAEVAFVFDLDPAPHAAPGTLPMAGHARGSYDMAADALQLSLFLVNTPASRVQASGSLSSSSALKVSVSTSSFDEWRPLVAALHGPAKFPFSLNGDATFNGVVSGSFSSPTVAGTLAAQDFDFTLPATARSAEKEIHWDSLSVNAQWSAQGLSLRSGSLHRDETSANFDITAALRDGQFTSDSLFSGDVALHKVDVTSTAALAGYDVPISGTADVTLQLSGTRSSPEAQGQLHVANGAAYGESIAKFDAGLRLAGDDAMLDSIHLVHEDAIVTGSAAYNSSTRVYKLDLAGQNFDLAALRQIHLNSLSIEGRADFTLRASGTPEMPEIKAALHLHDLTFDHELSGDLNVDASSQSGILHVTGQSQFRQGSLVIDGNVRMRDDYPANFSAQMDHLDLDSIWRAYLRGELTGHSAVAGTVTMQGPLRYPQQWVLKGDLSDVALDVEHAKLHNKDVVLLSYAGQTLRFDHVHLVGEGTDISTQGTASFAGDRQLDLAADGSIDLKLLNSFDANLAASGLMTVKMNVGGTWSQPVPQGRLQIANASFAYAGLPSGLTETNGSLLFTRDHFHIENLSARTGGGTLDFKGDATTYNRQFNFNLTASGKEVRLRYPPGVSSTANADLHWVGTRSASTVSGQILVTKLAVTPNFDFSSYLERSRQITSITPASSPLYNVKLDIQVQTSPELQMKTAVARLSGDADLRLRGSVAHPAVLGRADILEGEASFNGTKFRLERGDITFANPVTIDPILNLEASTHVRNYDLAITVTGTPDQPGGLRVSYRSEPPLPQSDIIALLALGRTSEESEQLQEQSGQTAFTDQASAIILNQAINSTVSSRVQKLFGVSRIKIDPQGLTTETNPTARGPQVTIEQQFANNVTLTYSTNVSQSSQQIIQGEYFFTRNLSAVGTRDQNGVVSFDLRIRRRKK